jgi:hypothetical protein
MDWGSFEEEFRVVGLRVLLIPHTHIGSVPGSPVDGVLWDKLMTQGVLYLLVYLQYLHNHLCWFKLHNYISI